MNHNAVIFLILTRIKPGPNKNMTRIDISEYKTSRQKNGYRQTNKDEIEIVLLTGALSCVDRFC